MTFEATLEWKPKAKERPRFTKSGRTYTPKATVEAEAALAHQWREHGYPTFPAGETLHVSYSFGKDFVIVRVDDYDDYMTRSLRGDVDNYMKTANDGLNGVAWDDDRQIVRLEGVKL